MKNYDHKKIESKIQKEWEKKKIYSVSEKTKKPKFFGLIEFPYPSGDGLHVGHIRSNTAMDIISRKRRMDGYNVLYPIGWDAFGLPTENYAIKTGKKPALVTKKNTDTFRRQLKEIGFSFDWSREINTTDPAYYKWTQWIFLQFFKKGLAYKSKSYINWCPKDKIGLANEEAVGGICDRCGSATEKREKEQWMLAITKYADRLDKDLDLVDYPERVKSQQKNWIGKSEGSEIEFKIVANPKNDFGKYALGDIGQGTHFSQNDSLVSHVKVFTTRADTLFGVTYVVLAPEHPLVAKFLEQIENKKEVEEYIQKVKKESELERTAENKDKTGIELKGVKAINPANNEEVPVWIADYVLVEYGTGAVMAVPGHDYRDLEFADKYNLGIKHVINPKEKWKKEYFWQIYGDEKNNEKEDIEKIIKGEKLMVSYTGDGYLFNSENFSNLSSEEARKQITKFVGGKIVTKFKLRDWVFSRQRYWGEPIPVVNCEKCGLVPLKEKDLPLKLPEVKSYKPTDNGESPLASISKWVNTKCPKCGGKAKRETDTMPNWAGSSWYYLRYTDSKNKKEFANKKSLKYWLGNNSKSGGVDWYNGGMEHTTLHLLYSRFWHKFLYDLKLVPTLEPYQKRTSHGMILGAGGVKMSKSVGNVVNPDSIVKTYGADTLRVYEMFMGPFEEAVVWNTDSIIGSRRFIEKVWRIGEKILKQKNSSGLTLPGVPGGTHTVQNSSVPKFLHKTIKKVTEDIESMRFNTAVSSMMILATEMEKSEFVDKEDFKKFLQILAPFAPHVTEELWNMLGEKKSIHFSDWPKWDETLIVDDEVKIVVQVNGKVRAEIMIKITESEESIKERATSDEAVLKFIAGNEVKKIIYVKNRLVNIVI